MKNCNVECNTRLASPLMMWGVLALFYVYQFVARSSIPTTLTNNIMLHYSLDASGVGALLGCYYYAYAAMQVPAGMLLDKFGTRYTSMISTLLCALGIYIFIATNNCAVGAFGQTCVGIGAAFAVLALFKCINSWFCPTQVTIMTSVSSAFGSLGPVIAGPAIAKVAQTVDWKSVMIAFSILGVALAVLIYAIVRDKKNCDTEEAIPLKDSLIAVIKNRQIWVLSIYSMMIYAPISALADLWGVSFIKANYNVATHEASIASNMIYIGIVIGCPLLGMLSNAMKSHKNVMVISGILCAISFAGVLWLHLSFTVMSVLLFFTGFGASGAALTFVSAMRCVPSSMCGIATGFVNMVCMLSGVVLQPLIGYIVSLSWDGKLENGLAVYRASDYTTGLTPVMVFLLVCVLSSFCMRETYAGDK